MFGVGDVPGKINALTRRVVSDLGGCTYHHLPGRSGCDEGLARPDLLHWPLPCSLSQGHLSKRIVVKCYIF